MQNLPMMAGARGWRWRVEQTVRQGCGRTHLVYLSRETASAADRLVAVRPHEPVAAVAAGSRLTPMPARQAAAIVSAAARASRTAFALHTAERLRGDIHAWQLCAALAFERGWPRVLVADEAGMGKTVAAAIAIGACLDALPDRRCLVLAPGHLLSQWRAELQDRLAIDATAIDAAALRRLQDEVPAGIDVWALPGCLLASLDFFKQPHILRSLRAALWDLVVVDEAHLACGLSERHAAVSLVAARARRVLLLTATPSDGGGERLRALCALGAGTREARLICLRHVAAGRVRAERVLRVAPSPEEQALHDALARYVRWLAGASRQDAAVPLLCSVLIKRAVSSPHALHLSLLRRRAALETAPGEAQLALLESDEDAAVIGAATGLPLDRERRRLDALIELALRASRADRRLDALARLVRRAREPVVIFSCFRDTADTIAARLRADARTAIIHGALPPAALHGALGAFTSGRVTVLAATDVASQGLNLHARCRWVIHYDLPWRPPTIRQRVGRVDRLGQTRRVHATLLESASTLPHAMRARLAAFAARMQDDERITGRRWDTLAAAEARRLHARRQDHPHQTQPVSLPAGEITAVEIETVVEGGAALDRRVFALRAGVEAAVTWGRSWAASRMPRLARALAARAARRTARELDVRDAALASVGAPLRQDGLFERRADRQRAADAGAREAVASATRDAIARHAADARITAARARAIATFRS